MDRNKFFCLYKFNVFVHLQTQSSIAFTAENLQLLTMVFLRGFFTGSSPCLITWSPYQAYNNHFVAIILPRRFPQICSFWSNRRSN